LIFALLRLALWYVLDKYQYIAFVWYGLSEAYSREGDSARALKYARRAASMLESREGHSYLWAVAALAMAALIAEQQEGDQVAHVEAALQCLESVETALITEAQPDMRELDLRRIFEPLGIGFPSPDAWTRLQMLLGMLYTERPSGKRTKNLRLALARGNAALERLTPDTVDEWYTMQNRLRGIELELQHEGTLG
jgi:tetratricopeptide (TPR) repeat protein